MAHGAAMLHSLLSHHQGTEVHIDYMHGDDTSEEGRRRLAGMVSRMGGEIAFHEVDDARVEGLPVAGFTGKATWYRIFLDELLPNASRILYLDLDLLVKGSLLQLWNTSLEGNVIGAVTNVPPPMYRAYTERPELGGDRYFNVGVALMDLELIRREAIGNQLRTHARRHARRLMWRDQDVINEVLHARRLPLHPKWNCMNSILWFEAAAEYFDPEVLSEARRDPVIRHFEGPVSGKPWHVLGDIDGRRLYDHHRRETPWSRVHRIGWTPMNVLRYWGRLGRRRIRRLRHISARLKRRLV